MITNFEEVWVRASKSLPCPVCGRRVRRTRKFMNTVNPWNRTKLGVPKTRAEVANDVNALAAEWRTTPERHAGCAS